MEIIIFPYMAISFSIAWTIFSPFSKLEQLGELTFAKIQTSDLIASFVPIASMFTLATWIPQTLNSALVFTLLGIVTLMLTGFALLASLFLFAKMKEISSLKRMVTIAVVIPLGLLVACAWIALPLLALGYSATYSIPATIAILPTIMVLRQISFWVCKGSNVME